ncbi:MAG: hydroxymethylglutaryl-CoA lyase [Algoriphagus sp.]|jgi:hydroxymethylglutaryl-CoA lyase
MKLIECPRDAIQGIKTFIPTKKKIDYLNYLISLDLFDVIDFGSFVSQKVIPQMADSKEVIAGLNLNNSKTKLLAIIANKRGAEDALKFQKIDFLGYPFSVSETFQRRNTNSTIEESLQEVKEIYNLCRKNDKKLVLYLSMAFGNPYGDEWNKSIVLDWIDTIQKLGITIISLADTVGLADKQRIREICAEVFVKYPHLEIGVHLHSTPDSVLDKVKEVEKSGIKRFDGAILGFGGCPMANDELVGNMPMESLLTYFNKADDNLIAEMKEKFLELIENV